MKYDELVKRLRAQAVYLPEKFSKNAELLDVLMKAADAIELLQKTQQLPRWIPVEERLPEEMKTVLVTDGKNVGWSFCVNDYGTMEFYSTWEITHWMPLPQPPKGENE